MGLYSENSSGIVVDLCKSFSLQQVQVGHNYRLSNIILTKMGIHTLNPVICKTVDSQSSAMTI